MRYTISFTITEKHFSVIFSSMAHVLFIGVVIVLGVFWTTPTPPQKKLVEEVKKEKKVKLKLKTLKMIAMKAPAPTRALKRRKSKAMSYDDLMKSLKKDKVAKTQKAKVKKKKNKDWSSDLKVAKNSKFKHKKFDLNGLKADQFQTTASFDIKGIRDVLEKGDIKFQSCYERSLARDEFLSGRVPLEITISSNGRVDLAKVGFKGRGKKMAISGLIDCVKMVSKNLKFPKGIDNRIVKFGLLFKS